MPTSQSLALIGRSARAGRSMAMANYGLALHQRGDHTDGLRWLQRAWDAGNGGAGFNLGTIYQMQGETSRAEVIWQKAAALGDEDAMVGLVRLALGRREHDAAARWVAPVLGCDEPFAITALALAFLDYGDESTAVRALTRAVALNYPPAMDHGARLLDKQGKSEQAAALRARARAIRAQLN